MKTKFTFMLLSLCCIVCSCTQEEPIANPTNTNVGQNEQIINNRIPEAVAIEYAKSQLAQIDENKTRSASRQVASVTVYGNNAKTRSGEPEDTLLYLINFSDDEGFALVSADARAIPIYAISDTGNFNITETNEEVLGSFVEGAKQDVINHIIDIDPTQPPYRPAKPWPSFTSWYDQINFIIRPKLSAFQRTVSGFGYFAQFCTNSNGEPALSGCVAVGCEQILAYHEQPTKIDGNPINWYVANSSRGTTQVAIVLSLIGSPSYLNLNYKNSENLATGSHSRIPTTFTKLGYNHCGNFISFYDNEDTAVSALNDGPILMQSYSSKYKYSGHVWVIDGIIQYEVDTKWPSIEGTPPNYVYPNLFHCVWGFPDGDCNGYYYAALYGFIGTPSFKASDDTQTNDDAEYAYCDSEVKFMYGFKPRIYTF